MRRNLHSATSVAFCLIVTCCSFAGAAQPVLSRLEPTGVQRGGLRTVVMHGTRLKDAREVVVYEPGITIKEVKPSPDNNKVEVQLEVAPDCRVGMHAVQVVTASGVSELRLLSVGNLPEVAEVEPNGDFASPQVVPLGHTVTGVIQSEDEDFFALDLKAGQRLVVEVEGVRTWAGLRNDFFDPYVAILDANRYEKAVADDIPLLYQDPVCSFTAPTDGRYVVLIRDSSYGGAGDFIYRMHLGLFPRPMAVLPAGGQPGQVVDATFVDVDGGLIQRQIQMPSTPMEEFPLTLETESGMSPSPNMVRVTEHAVVLEKEPNNDIKSPTVGVVPAAFCGLIGEPKDEDFFQFEAKKGQKINVRCIARKVLRSPLDSVVNVYGPEFNSLAGNDDSGGPDSLVTFTAPADGPYRVRVTDHLQSGGPNFAYRIEVSVASPSLALSLPEVRQDETVTIAVPRGGHMAVMVNASRQEFGGELTISAGDLPPGVTVEPVVMRADQTTVPVLLSAAADAPLASSLASLTGKPVAEQPAISGGLKMRHKLVRGQNRVDVFGYDAERVPLAVIEPSPVSLETIQPQVPIVRNGNMNLKVKINRPEGFKEAVPVRLLYNPPGIGSSGSVSIAADKTEAEIPLTANASGAIGVWPVIVIATVNTGNGSLEIASKPIQLEIADAPFVFEFPKASGEQGGKSQVVVRVTTNRKLDGPSEVELVGIPAGVTLPTPKLPVTQETEELIFPVEIAADARVGQHKTLVCRATIHAPGGEIVETLGSGTLQIDQPLPAAKPVAAAPTPAPKAAEPPKPAAPKPLTRLEQLRQAKEVGQ